MVGGVGVAALNALNLEKVEPLPEDFDATVVIKDPVPPEAKEREIVLGRNVHTMSLEVTEPDADDDVTGEREASMASILSRYRKSLLERTKHHLGYPYNLDFDYGALGQLQHFSINNLGDPFIESNYGVHSRQFEVGVLDWFARLWELEKNEYWGYITNCGTEGNLHGILVGREVFPDGILYASRETHYSIFKAARMYRMECEKVGTLLSGEIDCEDFKTKLLLHKDKPAIINVNIGTTVKGAVDDLDLVIQTLEETGFTRDRFYIHCDGALFGLMMPFVKRAPKVSFKKPIGSVSVSGHKFVGCPMPCGVQITRLEHINALSRNVEYLASRDATIMGSRNGHAPIFLWYTLNRKGYRGFQKEVQKCLKNAHYLKDQLRSAGIGAMLNELSSTVVFERPHDEEFVRKWQLACQGNIAHVIVMPNITTEKLDIFLQELVERRATWYCNGKVQPPCVASDIGTDPEDFTITLHHSGKFRHSRVVRYVGGDVSHIDYCNVSEISLQEIYAMSEAAGFKKDEDSKFYCSQFGENDLSVMDYLWRDEETLKLDKYLDEDRVVHLYTEGGELYNVLEDDGEPSDGVANDTFRGQEEVGYDLREDLEADGEDEVEEKAGLWDELIQDKEAVLSDDANSVGSDTDLSEGFSDSGEEWSDDESLYVAAGETEAHWIPPSAYDEEDVFEEETPVNTQSPEAKKDEVPEPENNQVPPTEQPTQTPPPPSTQAQQPSQKPVVEKLSRGQWNYMGYPVFNPVRDMTKPIFHPGLCFQSAAIFRRAVREFAILVGRDISFVKNDKHRIRIKCKNDKCDWMIYASEVGNCKTLIVKTWKGKHICQRQEVVKATTSTWVAEKYQLMLKYNPGMAASALVDMVRNDTKIKFTRFQMYRAKSKVKQLSVGNDKKQYALLWRYAAEIVRSDPDNTVRIKTMPSENGPIFKRFYICWGQLKKGYKAGCRKILCFDGCHLKGYYGGILLSAIGIDANNCLFPIAYAVVEKEKRESWVWFMDLLVKDLDITEDGSGGYVVISDKQKGLIDAVESVFPYAQHRFCVMHMYGNFKQSFKGLPLKTLLWQAAKSTRVDEFEGFMKEIRERDLEAFKWLAMRPARYWSRSYFKPGFNCDVLLNNMCESFNAMILEARPKPIIDLLEHIRLILMKRTYVKRDLSLKWIGEVCPNIHKVLEKTHEKSSECKAFWNGAEDFEVSSPHGQMNCNIARRECTCRKWQISGIPCAHGMAALYFKECDPSEHVEECFKISAYNESYKHCMHTLRGPEDWPLSELPPCLPPIPEKLPGRPKKNDRIKPPEELEELKKRGSQGERVKLSKKGVVMNCGFCHKAGHNKRTCPKRHEILGTEATTGVDIPPKTTKAAKPSKKGKKKSAKKKKDSTQTASGVKENPVDLDSGANGESGAAAGDHEPQMTDLNDGVADDQVVSSIQDGPTVTTPSRSSPRFTSQTKVPSPTPIASQLSPTRSSPRFTVQVNATSSPPAPRRKNVKRKLVTEEEGLEVRERQSRKVKKVARLVEEVSGKKVTKKNVNNKAKKAKVTTEEDEPTLAEVKKRDGELKKKGASTSEEIGPRYESSKREKVNRVCNPASVVERIVDTALKKALNNTVSRILKGNQPL